jgi:hypothetical protein
MSKKKSPKKNASKKKELKSSEPSKIWSEKRHEQKFSGGLFTLVVVGLWVIPLLCSVLLFGSIFVFSFIDALMAGPTDSGDVKKVCTVYDMGDDIELGDLTVRIEDFSKKDKDEPFGYNDDGETVALKIWVRNEADEVLAFNAYNMYLADSEGKLYTRRSYLGDFDGNKIYPDTYEEGVVEFIVDDADDEFTFYFSDSYSSSVSHDLVELEVFLGEPDDFSMSLIDKHDDLLNEDDNYGYYDRESGGLSKTQLADGDIMYASEDLDVAVTLPEDVMVNHYPNCLVIDTSLYIGKVGSDQESISNSCFVTDFGYVENITVQTEQWKIGNSVYDVKIEKLDYASDSKRPQSALDIEGDSIAFFHIVLRGDKEDPFSEDYLAIEYYDSLLRWESRQEDIKAYLKELRVE